MSIVNPASIGGTQQGGTVELVHGRHNDAPMTGRVESDGSAAVTIGPPPAGLTWIVERAVIGCDGDGLPEFRLYMGTPQQTEAVDGTTRGTFDVAEYPTGLVVRPGQKLLGVWTGAEPGALVWLRVQYTAVSHQRVT